MTWLGYPRPYFFVTLARSDATILIKALNLVHNNGTIYNRGRILIMDDETLLARYKQLDPFHRRIFMEYLRKQRLQNISEETMKTKLWKVYTFLLWSSFRPICKATPEDMENFYLHRKKEKAQATAFGDNQELKTFFKWLLPGKDLFKFKPQRPRSELAPEEIPQATDARELLAVCENQRDRALVSVTWDSGARLDEIVSARVGDVKFDQYGAVISVTGKTGRRNIRLVNSSVELERYLNFYHPMKDDATAPLFVISRKRGTTAHTAMAERTVQNLFRKLGDYAGTQKRCNPHAWRHGRATDRSKKMTEPEMRQLFGWSPRSAMPAVYVHLSSRDIDDKVLAVEGVKMEEEPAPDAMAVIRCPRCGKPNSPDAMFCGVCLVALQDMAIKEIGTMEAKRQAMIIKSMGEK